jgi:hypothetical protein
MAFQSILFRTPEAAASAEPREVPGFFRDLSLDRIVGLVTAGRDDYHLAPFFYAPLTDLDDIAWRQEIMRDLESLPLAQAVAAFAQRMRTMRLDVARSAERHDAHEQQLWFLNATESYVDAVIYLREDLDRLRPASRGLQAFRDYLVAYLASDVFSTLSSSARHLGEALSEIRYTLHIRGNSVTVRRFDEELDYGAEIEAAFHRFKREAVKDYRVQFPAHGGLNHVEARVLDCVAALYPETFAALARYVIDYEAYLDENVARFDREVQFYLAYLAFAGRLRAAGLSCCYPRLSRTSKTIHVRGVYDCALAHGLVEEHRPVVTNDFFLEGGERLLVVSGPNQGGKTTFARTVGQLHYLARLGCPVAGTEARLWLCDRLFTHFEREEEITTLRGKLQDDLVRIKHILDAATPDSLVILNEIFSSTTVKDALDLSRKVFAVLAERDLLAVCVTFLSELSSFDAKTVSYVSTVDPEDPTIRTFRLERRPAEGAAYALAIAEKYGLTADRLRERVRP